MRVDRNKGKKTKNDENKTFNSLIKHSIESQRITVKTFRDEENTYEVTSTYYKNIKRLKFELTELSTFDLNDKRILKLNTNINRGERVVLVEFEDSFQ